MSLAVIDAVTNTTWGRKGFISAYRSLFIIKESRGRSMMHVNLGAGPEAETMKEYYSLT